MATDTTTVDPTTITTIPITVTSTNPEPVRTMSTNNGTEYLIRFPPYPPVPDGVKITPFTEFKERGIRVDPGGEDNETEIDGCGVPTIPLASVHTTDWCKTETKRARAGKGGPARKKKKRKTGGAGGPNQRDWVEYWEDREASYRIQGTYDPHLDAYERLCQGAWEFKSGRQWPLAEKQSGPLYVWGEFLRFAGIPSLAGTGGNAAQAVEAANTKKQSGDDDSDSDLDDDADDGEAMAGILNPQNLASMDAITKAQAKGEAFLKDPALMLKVFLSSYARDRGIIWTELNLTGAPILMRFFLEFLVVNRVLPKREENAIKHESTRRVVDIALKELPLTSKLARVWPDEFHKACKGHWGSKAEVFVFRTDSPLNPIATGPQPAAEEVEEGWGSSAGNISQGDQGWGTGAWGEDDQKGWGGTQNSSAWDSEVVPMSADDEDDAMGENHIIEVNDNGEVDVVTVEDKAEEEDTWNTYQATSIFYFLGPTALPLTHTTGIVESSVRRIRAVLPPSADTSKFPITKDVSAEAVEGHLKRTFGLVVFEPWVNWNGGEEPHLAMPKILETSRGPVKTGDAVGTGEATASTGVPVPGALPPFDPHKDEISVLVDPSYLDFFSVGMGCLCTWVQMARVTDFEPQDPKKKKKKAAKIERFWYVDEALRVVPSYYTYLG